MGLLDPPPYVPSDAIPPGAVYARSTPGVFADWDTSGYQGVYVQLRGTFSGSAVSFETSIDGTDWQIIQGSGIFPLSIVGQTGISNPGYTAVFPTFGMRFRARATVVGSGTINVFAALIPDLQQVMRAVRQAIGPTAHDSAVLEAPVRVAGRAVTSNYTAVASNDVADLITTTVGAQVVRPFSIPESDWSYAAAAGGILNTTTAVTVKTAGAAGIRNYVTGLSVSAEALTNATELVLRDGAGGTVLYRIKIPTAGLSPITISFPSPLRCTAATLLEAATLTASGAGAVYVNLTGYQAP